MRLVLAVIAALAVAVAVFIAVFAGSAGLAWIFLFGDNQWPEWSSAALLIIPAIAAAISGWRAFTSVRRK